MNFRFYVSKKTILIVVGVIIIITLMILSVNRRLAKMSENEDKLVGYDKSEDDYEDINGDGSSEGMTIYDYEKVMPYFTKFEESMDFYDYLVDYIDKEDMGINEWWVRDFSYDDKEKEIAFTILNNENDNAFYIRKNNKSTYISKVMQVSKKNTPKEVKEIEDFGYEDLN